jgi:hypothetical protein
MKLPKNYWDKHKQRTESNMQHNETFFTPLPLIKRILDDLLNKMPHLKWLKWHDFCAADNRWAHVLATYGITCSASDINPLSPEVEKIDMWDLEPNPDVVYVANPPFSATKKLNKKFANCRRLLFGGMWVSKLPGINYSIDNNKIAFIDVDGNYRRIMSSVNYSWPGLKEPTNEVITGYERNALPKEERKNYLQVNFTHWLKKDERHIILK